MVALALIAAPATPMAAAVDDPFFGAAICKAMADEAAPGAAHDCCIACHPEAGTPPVRQECRPCHTAGSATRPAPAAAVRSAATRAWQPRAPPA